MADYRIAIKIAGELESSLQNAISGAMSALQPLASIGGKSVGIAGSALGGIVSKSAEILTGAVHTGMEFESAMSSVAATIGATDEQYAQLEEAARQMGRTTSKSAKESADALGYMGLAGWSVEQSIQGLPSILRLSEATGLDLADTSDLVTDSLSALQLTVDDLPHYLDVAAAANNNANTSAQALMQAYLGVGGVMAGLGVPLEESATVLGVLANRGIKGSEAGTALNAVMTNLTTGTGQAGAMMEQLGISAFDAEGNFIGLKATFEQLNGALAGMTDEERNAALAAIGGKTHVDALTDILAGLNTEVAEGVTEWDALQESLEGSTGALETMAKIKMDNLEGAIAGVKSAWSDFEIEIYKHVQEPLKNITQFATGQVNRLNGILADTGFEGLANSLGPIMGTLAPKLSGFATQGIDIGFNLINSMLSGIRSNAGSIASAAAEVATSFVAGFAGYYGEFWSTGIELFAQFVQGLESGIPQIVTAGLEAIEQLSQSIQSNLPIILESGLNIIVQLGQGIMQALPTLVQTGMYIVAQIVSSLGQAAPQLIGTGIQMMGVLFQALLEGITANLPAIIQGGVQIIVSLIVGLVQAIPLIAAQIPTIVAAIIEGLAAVDWPAVGKSIIDSIVEGFTLGFPTLESVMSKIGSSFVPGASAAGASVNAGIAAGISGTSSQPVGAAESTSDAIENAYQVDTSAIYQRVAAFNPGMAAQIMLTQHEPVDAVTDTVQQVAEAYSNVDDSGFSGTGGVFNRSLATDIAATANLPETAATDVATGTAQAYSEALNSGATSTQGAILNETVATSIAATEDIPADAGRHAATKTAAAYTEAFSGGGGVGDVGSQINGDVAGAISSTASIPEGAATEVSTEVAEAYATGMATGTVANVGTEANGAVAESISASSSVPEGAAEEVATQVAESYAESLTADSAQTAGTEINTAVAQSIIASGSIPEAAAAEVAARISEAFSSNLSADTSGISAAMAAYAAAVTAGGAEVAAAATAAGTDAGTSFGNGINQALTSGLSQANSIVTSGMNAIVQIVQQAMQRCVQIVQQAMQQIVNIIQQAMARARAIVQSAMAAIVAAFQSGMAAATAAVQSGMAAIVAAIQAGCARAAAVAQSGAQQIAAAFQSINLAGVGNQIMQGLVSGMEAMRGQVVATAQSIAAAATTAAKSGASVHSPSRATRYVGNMIGQGEIVGMQETVPDIVKTAKQIGRASYAGLASGMGQVTLPNMSSINEISQVVTPNITPTVTAPELPAINVPQAAAPQAVLPDSNISEIVSISGQMLEVLTIIARAQEATGAQSVYVPTAAEAQPLSETIADRMQPRTSVYEEYIGSTGSGYESEADTAGGSGTFTITYSPSLNFYGSAPSKQDIVDAGRISQAEFNKMLDARLRQGKRTSFEGANAWQLR